MRRYAFLVGIVLVIFLIWKFMDRSTQRSLEFTNAEEALIEEVAVDPGMSEQNLIVQNSIFESRFSEQPFVSPDFGQPKPIFQQETKSPMLAATLGIVPGLGHVYLKDFKTAGALVGSAGVGMGLLFGMKEPVGIETAGFYSVYSAYRDARLRNGMSGYQYPMPIETLSELVYAPFQWSVIKKPEVWGGIATTLALAVGALYLSRHLETASIGQSSLSLPMSLGEEAFFRGFLQSALSEPLTPWGGIALSSIAFGAAHLRNAFDLPPEDRGGYYTFGLPLLTGLGVYYGWLTYKNHSLKESVAAHTWYNFIVIMTSVLIAQRSIIGEPGFSVSVPF